MRGWRTLLGRVVVLHLVTGRSIEGLVWGYRKGLIVLRDAKVLQEKGPAVPLDGETVVDGDAVEFAQDVTQPARVVA